MAVTLKQLRDYVQANPNTSALRKETLLFRFEKNAQGNDTVKGVHIDVMFERDDPATGERVFKEFQFPFTGQQAMNNDALLRAILTDAGIAAQNRINELQAELTAKNTAHAQALAAKDAERQQALTQKDEAHATALAEKQSQIDALTQQIADLRDEHVASVQVVHDQLTTAQNQNAELLAKIAELESVLGGTEAGQALIAERDRQAKLQRKAQLEAELAAIGEV